jgi:Flp pilus assembly pilin Flp
MVGRLGWLCRKDNVVNLSLLKKFAADLIQDEGAQDLIEYALLTVFVAIVGAMTFDVLENAIGNAYANWDAGEQNLWEPNDP